MPLLELTEEELDEIYSAMICIAAWQKEPDDGKRMFTYAAIFANLLEDSPNAKSIAAKLKQHLESR